MKSMVAHFAFNIKHTHPDIDINIRYAIQAQRNTALRWIFDMIVAVLPMATDVKKSDLIWHIQATIG